MRILLRSLMVAFVLLLILTSGWLVIRRADQPAPPIMILDRGHMNDNDWRLYWFVPELDYLRPFTDPLYDLQVIGWWHDWLYFSGNTGWFEDTTGNQLRHIYRVRAGDHQPEWVVGPVIIRAIKWLPEQNRLIYPAPVFLEDSHFEKNRTYLYSLNLADGTVNNLTAKVPKGMMPRDILKLSADAQWVFFTEANYQTPIGFAIRTDGTGLVRVGQENLYGPPSRTANEWSIVERSALVQYWANGFQQLLPSSRSNHHIQAWLPQQNLIITQLERQVIAYSLTDLRILWQADGTYLTHTAAEVYIQQSDGSTVRIPLHGGLAEPVTADIAVLWGWTPDGKWLVYQDGNADVRRFHRDTHQAELMRPLNGGYLYNIGPSPDGAWWLFLESTATTTTLNRIRMNGEGEQPLLVLESRRPLPTTVFAGWTPPFEKDWQPMFLGMLAVGCGVVIGGVRRRF